jgi:plasmid stabilization system protein ParE
MSDYALTPSAHLDIYEIWAYIAARDIVAADRLEEEIYSCCQRIGIRPDIGHFRRDLTAKPVKFFAVRDVCLIVYDPNSTPIQVIRVMHSARDAAAELED